MLYKEILETIRDLIFPEECLFCEKIGEILCNDCNKKYFSNLSRVEFCIECQQEIKICQCKK